MSTGMEGVPNSRQFDAQIHKMEQQLQRLSRHKDDEAQVLRLDHGEFKVGPASPKMTGFLKFVRAVLPENTWLFLKADSTLKALEERTLKQQQALAEEFGQVKLIKKTIGSRRTVALSEARSLLRNSRDHLSVHPKDRVLAPYLEAENPFRDPEPKDSTAKLPNEKEMQLNQEREYRLVLSCEKVSRKLEQASEAAKVQQSIEQSVKRQPDRKFPQCMPITDSKQSACFSKSLQPESGHLQLDNYKTLAKSDTAKNKCSLDYETASATGSGVTHCQGMRNNMEDTHVAEAFTINAGGKQYEVKLTGVFDGHGSDKVARHASQNIAAKLKARLEQFNAGGLNDTDVWNAIKIAVVDVSNSYKPRMDSGQAVKEGTTANLVLQIKKDDGKTDLWVANTGDSRAMLAGPDGKAIQMSTDARPEDPRYSQQIENRGSETKFNEKNKEHRVAGVVSTAKAMGEHYLYGAVSARPDITRYKEPEGGWKGYTLIQTCDGVVDVSKTAEVCSIVSGSIQNGDSPAVASARLVDRAYKAEASDNLTAIVTPLSSEQNR